MEPNMKTVGEFEAAVIAAETDHDGGKVTLPLPLARGVLALLREQPARPKAVLPGQEAIARVAAAIEDAGVGYSLHLTQLVDGEETYTLTYSDGTPPLTFGNIDDGYLHVRARKREAQAVAVINALAPPEIEGGRFAEWSLKDIAGQCRMQSREQLDPEYSQFMAEVARRLFGVLAERTTSTSSDIAKGA